MKPVLENVCLCSIVRDEEMNPAGGIVDFINCTLPYVGNAVVVDTGSIDRTRDLLSDAQKTFPHLKVFDYQFNGYAQARNFSLEQARSQALGEYALVLDADERLFRKDFKQLGKLLNSSPIGINFKLKNIWAEGDFISLYEGMINPRVFSLNHNPFYAPHPTWAKTGETLFIKLEETTQIVEYMPKVIKRDIEVKHFQSTIEAREKKGEWYANLRRNVIIPPSQSPHFAEWKKLNPRRAEYK